MRKIFTHEKKKDNRFESLTDSLSPNKDAPKEEVQNAALRRKQSVSGSDAWFMDNDDSDDGESKPITGIRRSQSRESMRKSTVVFPSVPSKSNQSQKRPSIDREKTQYNIVLTKPGVDNKPKLVGFEGKQIGDSGNKSSAAPVGNQADTKHQQSATGANVNVNCDKAEDIEIVSENGRPARKGILKSPKKSSRSENTDDKRDKIKQDLKTKDLKELKDAYGSLKELSDIENNDEGNENKTDPRDNNTFHSPTMERRFSVKSASRKSAS